jgi:Zn-dependent peptidase ImmA (M78 family)/DNA-binding XRE family transcriptional regulator
VNTFTPSRLTLARKRRRHTKGELAALVGLTVRSISAYEHGDMVPSEDTIAALSRTLAFPPAFFAGPDLDEPTPDGASFRSLSRMTAKQRDAALAAGAIAMALSRWIDTKFRLPKVDVPDLRGMDPDTAAMELRALWGLGEQPVPNVVHLLEAHGVRVFSLAEQGAEVDAFSLWANGVPYVFLNTMKSSERDRFDGGHELGHLVLHRHGAPQGREAETEADKFASAFLMPRGSVLANAPRFATLDRLIQLKKTWIVSVAALAHRLHSLGLLSEWHYRQLCIEIAQRGYRKKEPDECPRETSQILRKVFASLREDGITKADVARELAVHPAELDAVIFHLVMVALDGEGTCLEAGGSSPAPKRPELRLVRG